MRQIHVSEGNKEGLIADNTLVSKFDREVRACIYALLVDGVRKVDVDSVAESGGWDPGEVAVSFSKLAHEHRIALTEDGGRVWMAHPFSGVPTSYRAIVGDRSWYANCAWDALAILSLLGDGEAHVEDELVWKVENGVVSPDGLVHLLVPARQFWEDIGFT